MYLLSDFEWRARPNPGGCVLHGGHCGGCHSQVAGACQERLDLVLVLCTRVLIYH